MSRKTRLALAGQFASQRHDVRRSRRVWVKLMLTGGLGTTSMLAMLRCALAQESGIAMQGLRRVRGDVRIDGKLARSGQRVEPGQTVVTGAGADAVFVIGRDVFLQRENSIFQLGQTVSDATSQHDARAAANSIVPVLRYVSGKILSVFGSGEKRLETSSATIGIRGTGCYIEADSFSTYFCLCYGEAEVVPKNAPALRQTLTTTHHESPITIGPGALMMASAEFINHTDDELILLESMVGRTPPFSGYQSPRY